MTQVGIKGWRIGKTVSWNIHLQWLDSGGVKKAIVSLSQQTLLSYFLCINNHDSILQFYSNQASVLHTSVQLLKYFCHDTLSNLWNELFSFNHLLLRHLRMAPLHLIFLTPPHKTYKKIIFTGVCDAWMYHFTQEDKLLLVFESESTFFYWFHRNFSSSVDTFSNKSKFLTTSLKILIRSYFMHLCFIFLYYYFLNKLYILYWNIWLNAKF